MTMNRTLETQPVQKDQTEATSGSFQSHQDEFDFNRWAMAVRQQMIASLRRRGTH